MPCVWGADSYMTITIKKYDDNLPAKMDNIDIHGEGSVVLSTKIPAFSFELLNEPDVKENHFVGLFFYNLNKNKLGDRIILWLLKRRGINI